MPFPAHSITTGVIVGAVALLGAVPVAGAYTRITSPTGYVPRAIALDPTGGTALVTGQSSAITPFAIPDLVARSPLSTGGTLAAAYRPDGAYAFMAQAASAHVVLLDTAANTVAVAQICPSGSDAMTGLAVGGATPSVYSACHTSAGATGVLMQTSADGNVMNTNGPGWSLGIRPGAVAVTPDGRRAYVASASAPTIVEVDTATGVATPHAIGREARAIEIDPAGTHAYLSLWSGPGEDAVVRVRLADFAVTGTAGLGAWANPDGLALHAETGLLYVAMEGSDTDSDLIVDTGEGLAIVDTATMEVTATLSPDRLPVRDVAVDADGMYAYAITSPALATLANVTRIQLRPNAPTDLRATAGDRSATIRFQAGSDNQAPIANYAYSLDDGASWTTLSPAQPTSPITIPGLRNGITYTVRLRALNGQAPGQPSAGVTVTPGALPANDGGASAGTPTTPRLRVAKATVRGNAITTSFTASGPGRATITGTVVTARRAGRAKAVTACTGTATVRKAGTVRMTCTLTTRAKALRRKGAVTVRLVTAFTRTGGTRAAGTQTVVLKQG